MWTKGANQLISDPAWGAQQDSPDWGGGKGEILSVLGTTTGSNIVLHLNYCRVLGPWNGQYVDYYQYWESQEVQIVMTSTWGMKLVRIKIRIVCYRRELLANWLCFDSYVFLVISDLTDKWRLERRLFSNSVQTRNDSAVGARPDGALPWYLVAPQVDVGQFTS